MIKYTLVCGKRHEFESWFANSDAFDKQVKRSLVSCPVCGSTKVEKALMTPRLALSKKRALPAPTQDSAAAPAQASAQAPVPAGASAEVPEPAQVPAVVPVLMPVMFVDVDPLPAA